jgi:hypothetical protein
MTKRNDESMAENCLMKLMSMSGLCNGVISQRRRERQRRWRRQLRRISMQSAKKREGEKSRNQRNGNGNGERSGGIWRKLKEKYPVILKKMAKISMKL